MKILVLCNKSPYPPKEGGPIAMNMIIEGLIGAGHEVKVLAVNSNKYYIKRSDIPADYLRKTGIELIDVDLRVKPAGAFFNLFTGKSYHVERFRSFNFRKRLIELLQQENFDVVQFEMLYTSPYLGEVRKYSKAKAVLRAHNIEHLIWDRIAEITANPFRKWYLQHLAKTLKRYELSILNKFDGIAAITEKDMNFFRKAGCRVPMTNLPFGIRIDINEPFREEAEFPSLFSIGAMNWIPNQEGIRWFLQNVWNDLHQQHPDLKFYIAGREMPEWILNIDIPNVVVVGEVPDAKQFMASKSIMVVPLFSGSGIRIKIIEGMASERAIVSTSIGAEGIEYTHGENILIANSACEFYEMLSSCIRNKDLCMTLGKNARNLIVTRYNCDVIIQKLLRFYQKIGV